MSLGYRTRSCSLLTPSVGTAPAGAGMWLCSFVVTKILLLQSRVVSLVGVHSGCARTVDEDYSVGLILKFTQDLQPNTECDVSQKNKPGQDDPVQGSQILYTPDG